MIRYHFTEFERHMKLSFTLIFLSAVLLACTPSGKEKIDSGRQNPSKSHKSSFGFYPKVTVPLPFNALFEFYKGIEKQDPSLISLFDHT